MAIAFIVHQNPNEYPVEERSTNSGVENTGRRVSFMVKDGDRFTNVELCAEEDSNALSEDEISKNVAPITRSVRKFVKSMWVGYVTHFHKLDKISATSSFRK